MTNLFQPLDLTVNRAVKSIVRSCHSSYYSGEVQKQLAAGIAASDVKVDVRVSRFKPMYASWLVHVYHDMQNKRALMVKGFEKAGIIDALSMDYLLQLEENQFLNLMMIICNFSYELSPDITLFIVALF
jgi:hypothetical protein